MKQGSALVSISCRNTDKPLPSEISRTVRSTLYIGLESTGLGSLSRRRLTGNMTVRYRANGLYRPIERLSRKNLLKIG